MAIEFNGSEKLGDIVLKLPKASEVFKRNGIDFCCGGDERLSVSTTEHGLDLAAILRELNDASVEAERLGLTATDWMAVPLEQLIDHIVNTHHAYLHQVFPPLSQLTTKILRVHGKSHGEVLSAVHKLFGQLALDMEEHMIKEEESIFPEIVEYEKNPTEKALESVILSVKDLDQEHDSTGDTVKRIRQVTNHFEVPEDACGTYQYVFQKLEEVEADIFQHIHLENNVLFVRLQNERLQRAQV